MMGVDPADMSADELRVAELAEIVRSGNIQGLRSVFAEMSDDDADSESDPEDVVPRRRTAARQQKAPVAPDPKRQGSRQSSRGQEASVTSRGKPGLNWNTTLDSGDENEVPSSRISWPSLTTFRFSGDERGGTRQRLRWRIRWRQRLRRAGAGGGHVRHRGGLPATQPPLTPAEERGC